MRAKKSFGQHFLTNEDIARKIADSLALADGPNNVLEVGPGKGMLTKYLLEKDYALKCVEADTDMVDYLSVHYPVLHGKIISADFLKLDLGTVFDGQPFCIIGNFPYNISSQIVFKMVEYRPIVPQLVGMFQKEMAERIIAKPGGKDYGVISVLTQAFYEGKYLFSVGNRNFNPPPKVLSGVIRLLRKAEALGCDEALFRKVVKQAFSQRRKRLFSPNGQKY
jgi:16S rRNA (adenine1518-N6/adenine1519-N6)-dimethyltransferase